MLHYSAERTAAILKKLLRPHNLSVAEVASAEGMSAGTLYSWRQKAKDEGMPVPGSGKKSDRWSAEAAALLVLKKKYNALWGHENEEL